MATCWIAVSETAREEFARILLALDGCRFAELARDEARATVVFSVTSDRFPESWSTCEIQMIAGRLDDDEADGAPEVAPGLHRVSFRLPPPPPVNFCIQLIGSDVCIYCGEPMTFPRRECAVPHAME